VRLEKVGDFNRAGKDPAMKPDYSSRALRRCRRGMNSTATKAIYEQSA
jgi:hypothetical protein